VIESADHSGCRVQRPFRDRPSGSTSGPRRFVMVHWEPFGDELAFVDGTHSGAGQLNHCAWLDYLHDRSQFGPIDRWLIEHRVDLGSSDNPATHAAWVAPMAQAHRIVHQQTLEPEP
jgi:hypothetical protein